MYILLYIIRDQKGKNKPSKPKNGNWAPKSVLASVCDISIDRKSYMEQEK
jgi:hypothetical protein